MTMKVRAILSLAAVLIAISFTGCGHYSCGTTFGNATCNSSGSGINQGGGNGNGGGLIAFSYFIDFSVFGAPSRGMALQQMDEAKGTFLTNTSFLPPITPQFPTGVVIVAKKFLYVPSSDGTLYSFLIDSTTGFLTNIGTNPIAVTGGNSVAASASGSLLFIGDSAGQQISVYTVNSDGTLTAVTGSPFATSGVSPLVMATDGQSKFLYATSGKNSTSVAAFSIGAGGALTTVAGSPFLSSVNAIISEPSGQFLLGVSGQSSDTNIHVFSINASSGALTTLPSVLTAGTPRNLAVHPNGKWVYTFSQDPVLAEEEAIEGFVFDNTTGAMTQMTGSPFTTILANGGLIEQSGQFLFGMGITIQPNGSDNTITPYSIDSSTGNLASWPAGGDSSQNFPTIDEAAVAVTDAP